MIVLMFVNLWKFFFSSEFNKYSYKKSYLMYLTKLFILSFTFTTKIVWLTLNCIHKSQLYLFKYRIYAKMLKYIIVSWDVVYVQNRTTWI